MKPKKKRQAYFVYILLCTNGSLYTGITSDIDRRLKQHNSKKGARYTRAFGPVELKWQEKRRNKSMALKREAEIKRWPKEKKWALILREPKF